MENQLKIHSFNLEQTKLKFDQKFVDHVFFYKIKKNELGEGRENVDWQYMNACLSGIFARFDVTQLKWKISAIYLFLCLLNKMKTKNKSKIITWKKLTLVVNL
jgi:hypothetical protein